MQIRNLRLIAVALTLAVSLFSARAQFTFDHVGTGATGSLTPNAETGSFTLVGGGDDIWSSSDNFDFAHRTVTGDFDIAVRVQSLEPVARWTKAGIMARETLAPSSRMAFNRVTPPDVPTGNGGNGANDSRFAYRTGVTSGPQGEHEDGSGAPEYPNGWVRLVRVGNVISAYASNDGATWRLQGTQDTATWEGGALPASLEVGLAVSRHSSATTPPDELAVCEFRDVHPHVQRHPASKTVDQGQSVSFDVALVGFADWSVQWMENGSDIPGATGRSYTKSATSIADNGKRYSARATDRLSGTVVTSSEAVLTVVADVNAPTLVSAAAPLGNDTQFDVVFSERVNQADAQNLANYSLPGVTLNSATLQADGVTVRISSSSLYTPGCKILTVNNVRDLAIPPNMLVNGMIGVIAAKGTIRYHQYNDTGSSVDIAVLRAHPKYPSLPDVVAQKTSFEGPDNDGGDNLNNYGAEFLGYIHPPVTGAYKFFVAADDHAELYVSTDEDPAHRVLIAREPDWANFRAFISQPADDRGNVNGNRGNPPANISANINLQAGCKYFVSFIFKEGGGGDYASVAWEYPGSPTIVNGSLPIQGAYLSPYNVPASIADGGPADATLLEGRPVTFSANIAGSPPLTVQWYRDGVAIPGATAFSYTIPAVVYPADNGATFYVTAGNDLSQVTSRTATLTVIHDDAAPKVVGAAGSTTFDRVTVTYDEVVDTQTAGDEFSYTLVDSANNGLNVIAADVLGDGKTVLLTLDPTTPLQLNSEYTVTASGIADLSGNVLDAGTATFHSAVEGCGGIIFEAYNAGGGNAVSILTGHPSFPNSPDFRTTIPGLDSRLAYPSDAREAYGARMRGVYVPPYSGAWVLYLRSDDAAELWFNKNGVDPAGKQLVQQELGCCQAFEALPTAPMNLIGGRPYYIEVLYKEGTGGDYAQVAARPAGSADALAPIGARDVGQYAEPGFSGTLTVTGPADQTVQENRTVTFSVNAVSSLGLPICYQWSRDGVPIAGATGPSYSFNATQADNGAVFSARASIVGNVVNSASATLNVTVDTSGPRVVSAKGSDTFANAYVKFNELVDPNTAGDEFNYTISGLSVNGADVLADGMTVKLTTSLQTPGTVYTVTVSGVNDMAATPNVVDPNHSTADFTGFTLSCGLLAFEAYNGIGGVAVSDLTGNAKYPDYPDETRYMNTFDTIAALGNSDYRNDFGARVHGVFIPPASGNWIFYLRSDDASQLFLNPNGIDPAGKVQIAEEPGCCGPFSAHFSTPQALVAGQHYFIEGIYKEGGGGDYIQVAAKLDTDPTNPDNLRSLGAGSIGLYTDPGDAQISITANPQTQTTCINPLVSELPVASFSVAASATPEAAPLNSENFNSGNGGYTVTTDTAFSGPWVYDAAGGNWHADGQAAELGAPMTSRLTSPTYTVNQSGVVSLSFSHRWSFEYDGTAWDGGQVRVSINGGPYTAVPGSAFTQNGYNGTIAGNSASALHGETGYTSTSSGHGSGARLTSTADIANLNPGDTVSVQFFYGADTNTRGGVPNWEIDSVTLTQGGQPGAPVFIQWQRNSATGWRDIGGAYGATYSFNPGLSDNGAQFRALLSSPGAACTTSSEATLTVIQANTAPKFDLAANASGSEDASQSVPGFASNIAPHSIVRTPVVFSTAFDNQNGLTLYRNLAGQGVVENGVLKLTTPVGSANGAAAIDAPVQNYESLEISWKSYIGDGAGGGADGYSVNIGDNIPGDPAASGAPAEEGHPNSTLTVSVDTFNNAELRNPDEGIQIEYRNAEIAFQNIPKDNPGDGNYLRKSAFVNAKLTVDSDGRATFTYDGNTISGLIPGYTGIRANRVVFWGRTGGASDNQWIDDLDIKAFPFDRSSVESGQNVTFEVSNNNPAAFAQQPAISPDGTLTYTPAPNYCSCDGSPITVTVVAHDNGGVACNGDDTSDAKTFTITIACVNDAPTATAPAGIVQASSGIPKSIPLGGTDPDCGDTLTCSLASPPAHGTVVLVGCVATYTSVPGYSGPDSFSFVVNDGSASSAPATVGINVQPPCTVQCVANVAPATCGVTFPNSGKTYAISPDGGPVCLALDGSASTVTGGCTPGFTWVVDGTNTLSGALVTACLEPGCHQITLIVNAGGATCQQTIEVCVVSGSEMCEQIISLVESTTVERKNKRPLIVSLKAAKAAYEQEDGLKLGGQMLQVFQHKVRAQIARQNPAEAALFDQAAEDVINATECSVNLPPAGDK